VPPRRDFRPRTRRRCGGFTFVETLIAASMIIAGLFAISTALVRSKFARVEARDDLAAVATLEDATGQLRGLGITAAYLAYAPNGQGQPYPAPGSGPGLPFVAGTLSDPVDPTLRSSVVVQFFTDETANLPEVGLPRDLDGDGLIATTNVAVVAGNGELLARVLPYQLSIAFRTAAGGSSSVTCRGVLTRVR
jgi:type II secretory pathway pseudopilin PulG